MEGSSLLPSVLSLRELWLIRTTLLFICLTCGNVVVALVKISERTWFDFQTRCQWETSLLNPKVSGEQQKCLSLPSPSCKHQHLLEVRLKRSCWISETQFQLKEALMWCITRAGDCPLTTHHYHSDHEKKMKWLKQITAVFILLFKILLSNLISLLLFKGEHPIVNIGEMHSHDVSNKSLCIKQHVYSGKLTFT